MERELSFASLSGAGDLPDLVAKFVAQAGDAIPREPHGSKLVNLRLRVAKICFHIGKIK